MRDFNRQVTIHFSDAATAKIKRNLPDFNGVQVFNNTQYAGINGDGALFSVEVPSRENTIDGKAVYMYPISQIDRIKIIDLPLSVVQ